MTIFMKKILKIEGQTESENTQTQKVYILFLEHLGVSFLCLHILKHEKKNQTFIFYNSTKSMLL